MAKKTPLCRPLGEPAFGSPSGSRPCISGNLFLAMSSLAPQPGVVAKRPIKKRAGARGWPAALPLGVNCSPENVARRASGPTTGSVAVVKSSASNARQRWEDAMLGASVMGGYQFPRLLNWPCIASIAVAEAG